MEAQNESAFALSTVAILTSGDRTGTASVENSSPFINEQVRLIALMLNNVFLGSILGIFGILGNIINIIIFVRNGWSNSINISLTSLAVGDIGALVSLQWFNVCICPFFRESGISFEPIEIQTLTAGFPHFYFTRVKGWITAFTNIERCLSILNPLTVKMIITNKVAMTFNIGIFLVMLPTVISIYYTTYFDWKFYPNRNLTLLGVRYTKNAAKIQGVTLTVTNAIMVSAFLVVIVCTIVIMLKLHQSWEWRRKTTVQSISHGGSDPSTIPVKEKRMVKLIVAISLIYVFCSLPMVCFTMARAVEPELNIIGRYANLNWFIASFVFLLQTINASINILLYYKMSSMYKTAFKRMLPNCFGKSVTITKKPTMPRDRTSIILISTSALQSD